MEMDQVFKALADPTRRRLLDRLNERSGLTLQELCEGMSTTRQAVSKHLAVLGQAGLVTSTWRGREKLHFLNAEPVNAIRDRWIKEYDRHRAEVLADLKTSLEDTAMNKFVYVTYIRTTPEHLWEALTDPAFTKRYWGVSFDTTWAKGAPITWAEGLATIEDPQQVVLEADPPRRLSYTWHTFTAEWGSAHDFEDELVARLAGESRTRVTFDLEPVGEMVKLTVVHDGFDDDSVAFEMVRDGWPALLSSLKTLLETGEPLPE